MAFEIHLRGSHRGAPREAENPFTKEREMQIPLVMDAGELAAARAILLRDGTVDDEGFAVVASPTFRLQWFGFDEEGGLVEVRGDLKDACERLFELATAGALAIVLTQAEAPVAAVTTTDAFLRARALADELGEIELVTSPSELAQWIATS